MRLPLVLLLSLSVAAPSVAEAADPSLDQVPAGAPLRLTVDGRRGTLKGAFVRATPDSLSFRALGGSTVSVPIAGVQSFSYVSESRPSPRKAALLGIGLGAVGGAALFVAAAQAGSEGPGGGGGGGGEGGGERGAPAPAPASVTATSAAAAGQSNVSNAYRAVAGAVIGGLAGGVLGALTGLGMSEDRWTTVAVASGHASLVPSAATPMLAVSFPLPRGRRWR